MSVRTARWRGFTVWLTGLSGAGKTTLAAALEKCLGGEAHEVEVLDGDVLRKTVSADLGFSEADRNTQVRRLALIACFLAQQGKTVIVAAISPYRQARQVARDLHVDSTSVDFVEVFVDCPLAELSRRDTKGLYAQARAGSIPHFTGVTDRYEVPVAPDVHVRTDLDSVQGCADQILRCLKSRRLA